jgi:hypothetical protein
MDVDTLGPVLVMTPEPASYSETTKKSKKAGVSPFKKTRSPSPSQKKKAKGGKADKTADKKRSSGLFESFGVQSIEDLLGDKDNSDSEIPTEPIESRKRRNSTSQIVTEIGGGSRATPQRQVSYTDDFETSISERIGADKGKAAWARKATESPIGTVYNEEETGVDYSEDFASETLSVAQEEDTDRSSHYQYSEQVYSDDEHTERSQMLR